MRIWSVTGRPRGLPVIGGTAWFSREGVGAQAFVAIGDNTARMRISNELRAAGVTLARAVHPSAVVMSATHVGSGVFIGPAAVIVSGTRIEDDVIVNTAASIDHDGVLMSGSHIAPGVRAAGRVMVGRQSLVGVGAILSAGVHVGATSVVGAGAVVLDDVPERVVVAGVPARVLRTLEGPIDWAGLLQRGRRIEVR